MLFEKYKLEVKHWMDFSYLCTDDAGNQARGRRIVALRHPYMIFIHRFAHHVNLIVKDLLGDAEFLESVQQASKSVNAINASSSKWLQIMKTCHIQTYGCVWALMRLETTIWNSMKMCLASQLQVRKDLQFLQLCMKKNLSFLLNASAGEI